MKIESWSGYWRGVGVSLLATATLTAILAPFQDEVGLLNQGLLYLLLTLVVASIRGRNVGFFTALLTNFALNFFFIEPLYQLTVHEPRNLIALIVFLIVSVIAGAMLSNAREAADRARARQAEAEVALHLSRAMSGQTEPEEALNVVCREVVQAFQAPGAAVIQGAESSWSVLAYAGHESAARRPEPRERMAAHNAQTLGTVQSLGQTGLSKHRVRIVFPGGRSAAYSGERSVALVPLKVGDRVLGVLRLDGPIGNTPFRENPEQLLSAIASEAALAVQRAELASAAAHAEALEEADELKTALLNAVSHDLRTPLASIIASAGSLRQTDVQWTNEERNGFAEAIETEAQRLDRLVGNLLDLSRIESGSLRPEIGWYDLAALIDDVLGHLRPITSQHNIRVEVAEDMPPIPLDYIQIDEVLSNLVENATKYSPPGSQVSVTVTKSDANARIEVSDEGPGIPTTLLNQIFEPFYRVRGTKAKGTGLGLAVARGLVEAHGGRIWVENRSQGGARFIVTLPLSVNDAASSRKQIYA